MGYTRKQRSLLVRKGVYPYEYMDSWSKFEEDRLPSIDDFYSKLNMSGISDDDYEHAKRVWGEFGLRNLGKYCYGLNFQLFLFYFIFLDASLRIYIRVRFIQKETRTF